MITVSPSLFRALVLSSWLASLAAALLDVLWPSLLPPSWLALYESAELPWMPASGEPPVLMLALPGALLLALVAAAVALCRFQPWGRRVSLWGTLLMLPLAAWLGPLMMSGPALALLELSGMLWGAALALAYASPLATRFQRT
ncbi:MAG: hypothetical protein Q4D74_04715 [Comamonadaceae bacterium]|nr:hypothetical protein [Comamonadaceae bacterium]